MGAGFLGLNPEMVDQMARSFDNEAAAIDSLIQKMNSVVTSNIPQNWNGNDANTFQSDWNGRLTSSLRQIASELRGAAQNARRNVQEQQQTSR